MITGVWGRKVGMTQIFSDNKVTPVTAIDVSHWFITDVKTKERDNYDAVQVGCVRDRYKNVPFDKEWLKNRKRYFVHIREVRCDAQLAVAEQIGSSVNVLNEFPVGNSVDVTGWSRGLGFAGVYKRHGFGGAAKSHGSMMGRRPGSIGFTRSSGEVMRGQPMTGHLGCERTVMKRLAVVAVVPEQNIIFVKGSVAGKSGSLVLIKKA